MFGIAIISPLYNFHKTMFMVGGFIIKGGANKDRKLEKNGAKRKAFY